MKPIYFQLSTALAATFALGASVACAQQSDPQGDEPAVTIAAQAEESGAKSPTAGAWTYVSEPAETFAYFGDRANPADRTFMLRCDRRTSRIWLARGSQTAASLIFRIRTETRDRVLTAEPVPMTELAAIALSPNDPLLDAIAYSNGHFAVETEGLETLVLPVWGEVSRVIEDCR